MRNILWWSLIYCLPFLSFPASAGDTEHTGKKAEIENVVIEMVHVPGGTFEMGDIFDDGDCDEKPVHLVTLKAFSIGRFEVTQKQWVAVMGKNPSFFKGNDLPVEQVSWDDCQKFINKFNQMTGKNYRLPTEAEWEYAARSGGRREKFSGSDSPDSVAWYHALGENLEGEIQPAGTHPVGTKEPNGLGIYDMSGNVWEWCSDWYEKDRYGKTPSDNQQAPLNSVGRVDRGGGWYYDARYSRCSNRHTVTPGMRNNGRGFRLASDAE